MKLEEFQQIVAQHGGLRDTPARQGPATVKKTTKDRYGRETTTDEPIATPPYRYIFNDGTTLTAVTQESGDVQVTDPGTALNKAGLGAATARAPANVPTDTTEPFIVTRNPDGSLRQDPNPNYQPKPATVPKGAEITVPARRPGQTTDLTTVKNEADAYLAQLNAQLAAGTIKAPEYGRLWDTYYQTTVKPKIEQANQEANAEAARAASRQAEADRRAGTREDRATSLGEAEFGRTAGRNAVSDALALLPYQVSPTFLREFAAGLNTLSSGGGHVSFSPEAFQIQLPDLNALAEQGAARAAAAYRGTAGVPFTPPGAVAGAPPPMTVQQSLAAAPMQPRPMPPATAPPPPWDPASAGGPGSSPYY